MPRLTPCLADGSRRSPARAWRVDRSFVSSRPGQRQERPDRLALATGEGAIEDQLAHRQVEDSETEGAENGDRLAVAARGRLALEDVGQRAADEIAAAGELLRQVQRGLRAADVIGVVDDVVAGQDGLRGEVAQRDVQDDGASRAAREVADVRPRRGRGEGDEGAAA